jgi:hypothetical protein
MEAMKGVSHDIRCSGRYSNRALPEGKLPCHCTNPLFHHIDLGSYTSNKKRTQTDTSNNNSHFIPTSLITFRSSTCARIELSVWLLCYSEEQALTPAEGSGREDHMRETDVLTPRDKSTPLLRHFLPRYFCALLNQHVPTA